MDNVPTVFTPDALMQRVNTGEVKTFAEWSAEFPTLENAIADAIASHSTQARVVLDDGDAHFVFAVPDLRVG